VHSGIHAGKELAREEWLDLRIRVIFDFCKWDVQSEDHSVLASFPLLMEEETAKFLERAAEALAAEAIAAEREILQRPELLKKLGLPRKIQGALRDRQSSEWSDRAVRVMRFDFHFTTEGWRISEVNADVPGGFIEASGWNASWGSVIPETRIPVNTSEIYAQALADLIARDSQIALVHATAYSDDRQVMHYLGRCLEARGMRALPVSPVHIRWKNGSAELCASFGSGRLGAVVRFFPADWMPRLPGRESWEPYFSPTNTLLSNPGSAIIIQTKRFPLIWAELKSAIPTWRKLLPETREARHMKSLWDDYSILKPALGRVGEGIGMPGVTPHEELADIILSARSHADQWVSQRRFLAVPLATEKRAMYSCIGVFTIDGKAAGFYGRVAERPVIDQNAQDAAVLIVPNAKGAVE
jgi:glutathionylspermidine synthase